MGFSIDRFIPDFGSLFSKRNGFPNPFNLNVLNAQTRFNSYASDREKLAIIFSSPAALKVFSLQCDLFSMGQIKVMKDKNEIDEDPFLSLIKRPNPFQTQSQFLWDFMFWLMIGNDYTYCNSRVLDRPDNKLYHLDPSKIHWPRDLEKVRDHMIFSDAEITKRNRALIEYRYADSTIEKLLLDRIIISNDLTNGVGNWYKGGSRLDALYKVVSNSEAALDSRNINIRYAGKFLIGSSNDASKFGLSEEEKLDIIDKMEGNGKRVFPLKTMVQIRRFVEDMKSLELGTAYQEDFFIIGGLYNIPKDVLEAYLKSSTFENQEKARMAHVAYTLSPKGEQWMDSFERHFGYDKEGKNISITWDHLPMMSVFKQQEADTKKTQIETFTAMRSAGIPLKQVNEFLGVEFKEEEKPKSESNGSNEGGEGQQNQAGSEGSGGQEEGDDEQSNS